MTHNLLLTLTMMLPTEKVSEELQKVKNTIDESIKNKEEVSKDNIAKLALFMSAYLSKIDGTSIEEIMSKKAKFDEDENIN